MTDYYVRKTGSDSNDGTNPTTEAWLTIDNAANNISAGVARIRLVSNDTSAGGECFFDDLEVS